MLHFNGFVHSKSIKMQKTKKKKKKNQKQKNISLKSFFCFIGATIYSFIDQTLKQAGSEFPNGDTAAMASLRYCHH